MNWSFDKLVANIARNKRAANRPAVVQTFNRRVKVNKTNELEYMLVDNIPGASLMEGALRTFFTLTSLMRQQKVRERLWDADERTKIMKIIRQLFDILGNKFDVFNNDF